MRLLTLRKQVARICAPVSFKVKYQWPELAALKFDISPSTQTDAKRDSSVPRTAWVNSVTESGRVSTSSNRDLKRGFAIWGSLLRKERIGKGRKGKGERKRVWWSSRASHLALKRHYLCLIRVLSA